MDRFDLDHAVNEDHIGERFEELLADLVANDMDVDTAVAQLQRALMRDFKNLAELVADSARDNINDPIDWGDEDE